MKTKKQQYVPQSLEVFWEEERYGETKKAILCPKHREQLFARWPNARGNGKFHHESACERCKS